MVAKSGSNMRARCGVLAMSKAKTGTRRVCGYGFECDVNSRLFMPGADFGRTQRQRADGEEGREHESKN